MREQCLLCLFYERHCHKLFRNAANDEGAFSAVLRLCYDCLVVSCRHTKATRMLRKHCLNKLADFTLV